MPRCAAEYFEANYIAQRAACNAECKKEAHLHGSGIDHVYIVHYSPLTRRREYMEKLLAAHHIRGHFVLGFDKEALTPAMVSCFHTGWQPSLYRPSKRFRHQQQPLKVLRLSQVSVVIKHHSALYDMVRHNYSTALILEDDAFLRSRFRERLRDVMALAARHQCDIVMVGGCMNMHAYRAKYRTVKLHKHLYEKQEARCAHAFVATQHAARALLSSLPLTLPIDFQITAAMQELKLRGCWVEPWLSIQGNLGGCVTFPCVSIVHKYDRAYDVNYANDSDPGYERVPDMGSR